MNQHRLLLSPSEFSDLLSELVSVVTDASIRDDDQPERDDLWERADHIEHALIDTYSAALENR